MWAGAMGIGSVRSRNGQVFRRRKLCVGWGGPCFACEGRGELGVALEVSDTKVAAKRPCPVCRGRWRAIVVGLEEGRTHLGGQ